MMRNFYTLLISIFLFTYPWLTSSTAVAGVTFSNPGANATWYQTHHYNICWSRTTDVLPPLSLSIEKASGGGKRYISTGFDSTELSECFNWGVYHDLPQVPHRLCLYGTRNGIYEQTCSPPVSILAPSELSINNISLTPDPRNSADLIQYRAKVEAEGPDVPETVAIQFTLFGLGGAQLNNINSSLNFASNNARWFQRKFRVPHWGIQRIELLIDSDNQVRERDEDNNKAVSVFAVNPEPDLQVYVDPHIRAVPVLKRRAVRAYIKNIGDRRSAETTLRFWIEKKGTETYTVPHLDPGESWSVVRRPKWTLGGMRDFTVTVDPTNVVSELSETNNSHRGRLFVRGIPVKFDKRGLGHPADLRVRMWVPDTMRRNKKTPVLLEVKNLGKSGHYKAENITLTTTLQHAIIKQGHWSDVVTTFSIPELLPGEKRIFLQNIETIKSVNSLQRFTAVVKLGTGNEPNQSNNTLTRNIAITN